MSNQPNNDPQPGTSEASSSTVGKSNLKRKRPQKDQDPDSADDDTDGTDTVCCTMRNCLSKISKETSARLRNEYREQEEQSSDLGRAYLRSRIRYSRVKNPQPTRRSATYQYLIPDDGSAGKPMVVCQQAFCMVFRISERSLRNARDESCKYHTCS